MAVICDFLELFLFYTKLLYLAMSFLWPFRASPNWCSNKKLPALTRALAWDRNSSSFQSPQDYWSLWLCDRMHFYWAKHCSGLFVFFIAWICNEPCEVTVEFLLHGYCHWMQSSTFGHPEQLRVVLFQKTQFCLVFSTSKWIFLKEICYVEGTGSNLCKSSQNTIRKSARDHCLSLICACVHWWATAKTRGNHVQTHTTWAVQTSMCHKNSWGQGLTSSWKNQRNRAEGTIISSKHLSSEVHCSSQSGISQVEQSKQPVSVEGLSY